MSAFRFAILLLSTNILNGFRLHFPSLSCRQGALQSCALRRDDFPILSTEAYPGKQLVFLDSAASSQKPLPVLQAMDEYYKTSHANVHRGAYRLANRATEKFEWARDKVKEFVNAKHREEIIFTRGATDAINLVALSWGQRLQQGDEIILSVMEHHSNIVPWQLLAQRSGATLKFVPLNERSMFDLEMFKNLLSTKTKMVAVVHASNVLGYLNPISEIVRLSKQVGSCVLIDGCQSIPHVPIDVQALGADFVACSAHKMCGPTGIGFLYGKQDLLNTMPPAFGGGEMIDEVDYFQSTYAQPPYRFEAGTPPIAEAVGFGEAIEYLNSIGMDKIYAHNIEMGQYLYQKLSTVDRIQIYGPRPEYDSHRTGLVSFNINGIHPTDLSFFLDKEGIAVRTGHHCTQLLHRTLGISGSLRASTYFYNSKDDVENLVEKLSLAVDTFDRLHSNSPKTKLLNMP